MHMCGYVCGQRSMSDFAVIFHLFVCLFFKKRVLTKHGTH